MIAKQLNSLKKALVSAVKAQAMVWYDKYPAWSYVLECLSDDEIGALIGDGCCTTKGAIKQVYAKYVKGIENEASNAAF